MLLDPDSKGREDERMDGCLTYNIEYIGLRANYPTGVVIRKRRSRGKPLWTNSMQPKSRRKKAMLMAFSLS